MSKASAVEAVLFAALEKPTAAERNAFLDSACAGDAELRRQVDRLLQAHLHVGDFLQKPAVEQLAAAPESADATQEINASTDGPDAVPAAKATRFLPRTAGGGASDEKDSLDFLEPPTRAGSLGRLGHYEVLEVLGQGGFGIVFRAFDEQLQRVVAIKVLAPEMAATSPPRKRFLREARSSAKVRHENVVQIYAVEEEPLPYLVMEFVPGETLQQRLDRTGPMEVTEVVQLGRQIAEGLAAAHGTGLVHRDIKPGNILIEAGPNQHVKITDFGLARTADDASLTGSGVLAGTPMYMAPEQASADTLDHRADLFSLGSVLYTMCTGQPPFRAPSTLAVLKRVVEDTPRPIREIIPEVPHWLCDLIAKLHAKKPDDRIATAREVADLLGRGLAALQHPGSVKPPAIAVEAAVQRTPSQETPAAAPGRKPRMGIRRGLAAAAVFLLLLGSLGFTEATGVTHVRGTVIRLFSPVGTLVVEVDDPKVSVQIDGEDLVITGAGAKEIRLKPGSYTVKGIKDGKVVSRELVTVRKDGKQIVRVSQEATKDERVVTDPDRSAAEYLLSNGGSGSVKVNGQSKAITAATGLPRESFHLTGVVLWNADGNRVTVTDAGLAVFKGCKNLTEIRTFRTKMGAAGLVNFKGCTNLAVLSMEQSAVTDEELATFKDCKNLTYLNVNHGHVTDAGLAALKDCKDLTSLLLHATQVSDAGLVHLTAMEKLTELDLRQTQVREKGVEGLAKALPKCRIGWGGGTINPK